MIFKISKIIFFVFCLLINALIANTQNSEQQELDSLRKPIHTLIESVLNAGNTYTSQLKEPGDSIAKKELQFKIRHIQKTLDSLQRELCKLEIEFAKRHFSSPLSLEILVVRFRRPEGLEFYDVIDSIFRRMPGELQNSTDGKLFRNNLSYFKNSALGQPAPSFEVTDLNAQPLALSDFKEKKYVLIDFWASWCIPCRQDHPFLRQVYKKYQSQGLEIISISSDQDLQKWKAAIQQDGIAQWKHFSSFENKSPLEDYYHAIGIPYRILIDKKGEIIAKWLGGAEEEINEAMRKKFAEIFE